MRARHVTYYTISEKYKFSGRIERSTFRENNTLVLAGDRTLGLPRVKRAICQLSYENRQQTLAGFEPAPPKGTDFESVTLTTPSQRQQKTTCKSAALPLELTPPKEWRVRASIPLPAESFLEIGGIDPPTCRMRIDRSTT